MVTLQEAHRYHRQLLLPQIGAAGQERLQRARVLVVGVGGLGSPVALYLAAAGLGTIGLVEPDRVELSNLQRQVLYRQDDIGCGKVRIAVEQLHRLNSGIEVVAYEARLDPELAVQLIPVYDVVVDACDNLPTRFLLNRICTQASKPLVHGAVNRFEGQLSVFWAERGPCYRCLYPELPAADAVDTGETGVLGTVPGIIGTMQATEVIKLVAGIGEPLIGRLLLLDTLAMQLHEVRVGKDPGCVVCRDSRETP